MARSPIRQSKQFATGLFISSERNGAMPRLNPTFKQMVFFLYGRDPKTSKVVGPLGSGFFVALEGVRSKNWYMRHFYAVTCWHVAVQNGASIIRINTTNGKSRFIELEPHE